MIKVAPYKPDYSKALLSVSGLDQERRNELLSDLDGDCGYSEYLVALDDRGVCVGYAKTTLLVRGYEQINDIFVADNLRRQGVGSLILVAILTRGVDKYVLNVLAKCELNGSETTFFKARNFTAYDKSPFDNPENAPENTEEKYIYFCKNLLHMYVRKNTSEN